MQQCCQQPEQINLLHGLQNVALCYALFFPRFCGALLIMVEVDG
jgi:hypothetical protein